MWALAWVLGFDPPPDPMSGQVPNEISRAVVLEFLPGLDASVDNLLKRARPRTEEQVVELEDVFYCDTQCRSFGADRINNRRSEGFPSCSRWRRHSRAASVTHLGNLARSRVGRHRPEHLSLSAWVRDKPAWLTVANYCEAWLTLTNFAAAASALHLPIKYSVFRVFTACQDGVMLADVTYSPNKPFWNFYPVAAEDVEGFLWIHTCCRVPSDAG